MLRTYQNNLLLSILCYGALNLFFQADFVSAFNLFFVFDTDLPESKEIAEFILAGFLLIIFKNFFRPFLIAEKTQSLTLGYLAFRWNTPFILSMMLAFFCAGRTILLIIDDVDTTFFLNPRLFRVTPFKARPLFGLTIPMYSGVSHTAPSG